MKVKLEEVSTPTHFEHLVHIENLQSNANNFVVTELSHDPIIRNIFNMIEKNITEMDSNTISVTAPTNNDNITELYLESNMKSQESNPENVTVYIHDIETYDNLNNFAVSSCILDEKQSVQKRNNLKLNLKCRRRASDVDKDQSIPSTLTQSFEEKDNQNSSKSFLMLPTQRNLVSTSSSDSIETTSPITPITPKSVPFQYSDPQKQGATYDDLISENTRKLISPLCENQEAIIVDSKITDMNGSEQKFIDIKDQMEIQQALKQLDDALDEQITTESFLTLNPNKSNAEMFERKTESMKSKDSKKSVKQLVEMLNSKQLQFRMWNMPPKLQPVVANQNSDFTSDSEDNTEIETSSYISGLELNADSDMSHKQSKPSLIGVNIFDFGDGKSIAEIIAEKRSYKNCSLQKLPPTSPKPVLNKPLSIPKVNISDEDEEHNWLLPSSSQSIPSSEKPLFNDRKSKIQEKHQKTSSFEMLPTVIKVHDTESHPVTHVSTAIPSNISAIRKDSSQQQSSEVQYVIINNIYENLSESGNEKYLETSFDGPIAMTIISESKNGRTKKKLTQTCDKNASHMLHERQQRKDSVDKGKLFGDNTSTVISISSDDTTNHVHDVKWRNDHVNRVNFDKSIENDRNSGPIPAPRACFKRNSYDSVSDKQMMQRSTSMCSTSINKESNDSAVKSIPNNIRQYPTITNRSFSMSIPETARIPDEKLLKRPKPAPRQIDSIKRAITTVDVPEIANRNFDKESKRPVPIPRQSKLKAALNDDLLKKNAFAVTKIQHGIVNRPESMITIAKTMNKVNEEDSSRNEWMLRL
ncbi:unnamed protein product [Onchocerca ochengi]|uniref:CRIB domain-containing protein n=1 Tax=Onchocerca ochengi TaxID=42157 RepID=A0A182ED32_ONCOC|nr:unnamed protein product [Onchocerca ochengi]